MIVPIFITVLAICSGEDHLNNSINHKDNGSPSYGICQIKLKTARQIEPTITKENLMIPTTNFRIALKYYEWQLGRYKTEECAISAYNAGRCIKTNLDYVARVKKKRQMIVKTMKTFIKD